MNKVAQIKELYPLARFVAPFTGGLKPTRPGWFIGRCPFHQSPDDPPNKRKFWVSSEQNICGCFVPRCPAHGRPMDVINFWARLKGMTNQEAIQDLWGDLEFGTVKQLERDKRRARN